MATWNEINQQNKIARQGIDQLSSYDPDDLLLVDFERRFQEETARIRSEPQDCLEQADTYDALTPKQKRWLVGGAILVSSLVTAIGLGHKTVGEGFRAIFPDDSPPINQPVNKIVNNHS